MSSRSWITTAIMVVFIWVAGAGPLGAFLGKLGEVQSNDPAAFLPVDAESTEVDEAATEFDEEKSTPALVALSADRELTGSDLAKVGALSDDLADLAWVDGAIVGPVLGTDDASVAQLVVPLDSGADEQEAVEELRAWLDHNAPPELKTEVTGPAGYAADLVAAFEGIDTTLLLVAVGAVLLILVAVYRSPVLPVLVILTCLLALSLSGALVYLAASQELISLNGQSQGILFILVVGACTDYALLLVARHREELANGSPAPAAALASVRGVLEPVLASGGTVILGVLCLLAAQLTSTRSLGPVVALGVAAAVLAAMTFLPAILAMLGRAAFWPLPPHSAKRPEGLSGDRLFATHPLWGWISALVARRPRLIWLVTTAFLAAGAVFAPQFSAEGTGQDQIFRTEVESVRGQETLARGFGDDASSSPALILTDADHVEAVLVAAESAPGVAGAEVVSDEGTPSPMVVNGQALVEVDLEAPPESAEAMETVRDLRTEVRAVNGANAQVGGLSATDLDTVETAQRDFLVVVPLVLFTVFLVLIALLRSLVAPLLLMIANVLSFATALGVGTLVFDHVLDLPGADPVVPLFAFVFLVALGIDYSIFLMSRAREETLVHGHRQGLLRALTVTGGVITSAGVVLAATFAALAVIPLLFLLQLAFLVAVGVLVDALVVRTLLMPALALDVGPRFWWPGRAVRVDRTGALTGSAP